MKVKFLKEHTFSDTNDVAKVNDIIVINEKEAADLFVRGIVERYVETVQSDDNTIELLVKEEVQKAIKADKTIPIVSDIRPLISEDPKCGFKSFGHWFTDVRQASVGKGHSDTLKKAISGMSEFVSADGGFAVPPEFANTLLQKTYQTGQIASRCTQITCQSNAIQIPYIQESSRADGSRLGGVLAYWLAEGDSYTLKQPAFGQLELRPRRLVGTCALTDELMQDNAYSLDSLIPALFASELSFQIENGIINGNGAGQPLGIINSAAFTTVSRSTTSACDGTDIAKMYAACFGRSKPNAVWLVNAEVLTKLMVANFTTGILAYTPPTAPGNSGLLLGKPVIEVEPCSALGTSGDIILADLSQYILATKGTPQTAISMHVKFTTAEEVIRITARIDGAPWWASKLTPYKGSQTQSPFVGLS